jgi:hypothetical protein
MQFVRLIAIAGTFVVTLCIASSSHIVACEYCGGPRQTLSEEFSNADAVVLVQWQAGRAPAGMLGNTTFSVIEIARGPKDILKKDDQIKITQYRAGKTGDLFLLFGTQGKVIEWNNPLEVTETTYQYIVQAPSLKTPTPKRLEYFVKFLESSDELVSNDAFGEFANAPYEDIVQIKHKLDRTKIAKWLNDPDTLPNRLALYGLLLGLCGNDDDARMMLAKINRPAAGFPLGLDGLISGYLVLAGEKGLDAIDKSKLQNKNAALSEVYAAAQGVRFLWTHGNGRISQDRLRQSMRGLLDRTELADLVIADLARWEDWSVMDRLMKDYGQGEYSQPAIKRAIVCYIRVAAKSEGRHAAQAQSHLAKLRERDPALVKSCERFLP